MHPLEQRFVIMNVCGSRILFLREDGTLSDDREKEAKHFTSFTRAREHLASHTQANQIFGKELDNYSVIPVVEHVVAPKVELPSLPPPDFYEVGDPVTAEFIISIISNQRFGLSFIPVDNITGAGQMQAGVSTDPHDDRAVARAAKFSFPGWMEQDEIVKLKESATRHGQWKNLRIINRGNGFSKWFIVVLSQDLR